MSAFFWGYTFSQIISGYLASLYGAKLVLGASMLFASLLTLISPFAALKSVYLFLGIRALLGFFQVFILFVFFLLFCFFYLFFFRGLSPLLVNLTGFWGQTLPESHWRIT